MTHRHPSLRFHCVFGLAFVALFGVSTWLVSAESSPLHHYFLWHVEIPNLYSKLNIGPIFVGVVLSGNVHQASPIGFVAAAALQWFMIGFLLSFAFHGFR